MPLDPYKTQQVVEKADSLTKRFDALTARRAKRDADKVQRKADRARRDAERVAQLEEALKTSTVEAPPKESDRTLIIDPNTVPQHPWYDSELLAEERRELRTGALSKERI
jgi:hypothetical protein